MLGCCKKPYVEHPIPAPKSCIKFVNTFKGIIIIFFSQGFVLQCFVAVGIKHKGPRYFSHFVLSPFSEGLPMHWHREGLAPNLLWQGPSCGLWLWQLFLDGGKPSQIGIIPDKLPDNSYIRLWSRILYHFDLRFTGCDMWHLWTLSSEVHREKIGVTRPK